MKTPGWIKGIKGLLRDYGYQRSCLSSFVYAGAWGETSAPASNREEYAHVRSCTAEPNALCRSPVRLRTLRQELVETSP